MIKIICYGTALAVCLALYGPACIPIAFVIIAALELS